jgi:general secretion pathway protein D
MIKPLDSRIRTLGFCLGIASAAMPVTFAGNYSGSTGSLETSVEREVVRRQEDLAAAQRLIQQGDRALAASDYQTAYTSYMQAVDLIGSGPTVTVQRTEALGKFSRTSVTLAEYLIDHGKYGEAEQVAKTVLLPQYNPTYKPAITLLSNLEQPDYYNKTVTTDFAAEREQVATLLSEAEGFYTRGSYDLATKRYEQVLNVDRYNIAARKGMEEVNQARQKYYNEAYNETRARMLWQVQQGWELPVRKYLGGKDTAGVSRNEGSRNEAITAKLNRIVIPKLNLQDRTIREAVEQLRQLSRQFDTLESDPAKKGVNIFLKLPTAGAAATTAIVAPATLPADGAALPTPDALGATPETAAASPLVNEDTTLTLALNNIPLYEALRYVAAQSGLKIKIDPAAISIVPLSDISQDLITKEYKVPPTFIPREAAAGAAAGSGVFGEAVTTDSSAARTGPRLNAKTYLEGLGIVFPAGASAQYIPAGSRLVVTTTQDSLDIIDVFVDAAQGQAPTQVQIESKFVEINQNNLKELGFGWLLGPLQVGDGVYAAGGSLDAVDSAYPFSEPGGGIVGSNPVTRGLRSGRGVGPESAVSINGIDSLLGGSSSLLSGAGPGMFALAGVFTNPQFQMVIRAMDQRKGIDLMSAPSVTTKSGVKAVVNVVREFRYPTEFDPPQIPQDVGTDVTGAGGGGFGTSGFLTNPVVTPSTPSSFEMRPVGVTLEVTPTVGADGYTIDLELAPEVVDFDGFINYGTPIRTLSGGATGAIVSRPRSVEVSPNVINQPIFSTRKVTTNVTIWDGMTLSLGGLIREDVQKVQDKVPLLGDVPLVGRLFRSDVDQKLKKNLIIFVTAKLIDAEGKPLRNEIEKEEIVEALGLPDEISPPEIRMKGSPYK